MAPFKKVLLNADSRNLAEYDELAKLAARSGFQMMSAGVLAEPTMEQLYDKDDPWLQFVILNGGLMKVVETELVNGVISKAHIEKNAELIAEKSKILARHGLKGSVHLLEPQILPGWFYEKRPHLRGPACYNPCLALKRYYSPCIDEPEVLGHFREGVRKLLELAPEIGAISMYTNDSGAGICWCSGLYPGKNGPESCRDVPMGKRIATWLQSMLDGAGDAGKELEVFFRALHFSRQETLDTIDRLPKGAWLVFPPNLFPNVPFVGRETQEFIARSKKRRSRAALSVHTTLSYPLSPVASPPVVYHVMDTVREAAASGVKGVILSGIAGPVGGVDTPETQATIRAIARAPKNQADIDRAVTAIAKETVGPRLAGALISAWRDIDAALKLWPTAADTNHKLYPFYSVMGDRWLTRPLVPVPGLLSAEEKGHLVGGTKTIHDGTDPDSFFISEGTRNYQIDEFKWLVAIYDEMIEYMDRSVRDLETAFGKLEREDEDVRWRFMHEYRRVASLRCVWRTQRNVLRCGSTIEFFTGPRKDEYWNVIRKDESFLEPATYRRLFIEAMDDEVANMHELLRLMEESDVPVINTGQVDEAYILPPNVTGQMRKKIAVMEAHKADIDVLFPNCPPETFADPTYQWADKTTEDA